MSFTARRFLTTMLVVFVLIQMQFAKSGYAAQRPKIAFSSTRDGNSEIYVMDIDGRNHVRLTYDPGTDEDPSWSPDGERIAFVSRRSGVRQIYVMDSDGQNLVRLTEESVNSEPTWSPDGKKDCVHSQQRRVSALGYGRRRAKPDTVNSRRIERLSSLVA